MYKKLGYYLTYFIIEWTIIFFSNHYGQEKKLKKTIVLFAL